MFASCGPFVCASVWKSGVCKLFQGQLLNSTWGLMANETRQDLEKKLDCCGLLNNTEGQNEFRSDVALCSAVSIKAFNISHWVVIVPFYFLKPLLTNNIVHCMLYCPSSCNTNLSCEVLFENLSWMWDLWWQDAPACLWGTEDPGRRWPLLQLHWGKVNCTAPLLFFIHLHNTYTGSNSPSQLWLKADYF